MRNDSHVLDDRLSAKEIVVVADRYPPNAIGGAEVSLHYALSGAPTEIRALTLVVTFDDKAVRPESYVIDGVDVLRVPNAAPWPFNFISSAKRRSLEKEPFGVRTRALFVPLIRSLWTRNALQRLAALALRYLSNPKGGVQTDHLLDRTDCRYRALMDAISGTACKLVVADNTRSILLTSLLPGGPQKVAVVRDNRFNCARHNQAMIVGETYCEKCSFGCAPRDARAHVLQRWLHLSTIKRVAQKRRSSLRSFPTVIVTSHFLARGVRGVVGEAARISRIPNFAGSPLQITGDSSAVSAAHDDLLYVGMMNEAKGQLEFIQKASDWIKSDPRRRIVFAGKGERTKVYIKRFADANGLSGQLVFLDYLADRKSLFSCIQSAKLVILPTRWKEPSGRVPLEAGLAGKAVVAFGVGGLCETIIHEKTGLLVEPGDYEAFVQACERLLRDDALRLKLGDNARRHIETRYSEDATSRRFIETIVDLYRSADPTKSDGSPRGLAGRWPRHAFEPGDDPRDPNGPTSLVRP